MFCKKLNWWHHHHYGWNIGGNKTFVLVLLVLLDSISLVYLKPVILINKGQIHVRDSVQRFGHIHTKTRGSRLMNWFGINRRSGDSNMEPGIHFSNNYWYPDQNSQQSMSGMDVGFRPIAMPPSSQMNSFGTYQTTYPTTTIGYAPPPQSQTVKYFADSSNTQPQTVYVGQPSPQSSAKQMSNYSPYQNQVSPKVQQHQTHQQQQQWAIPSHGGGAHGQNSQQPSHIRNKRLQTWMNGMNRGLNDAMKNVRKAWRTMMYRRRPNGQGQQQQGQGGQGHQNSPQKSQTQQGQVQTYGKQIQQQINAAAGAGHNQIVPAHSQPQRSELRYQKGSTRRAVMGQGPPGSGAPAPKMLMGAPPPPQAQGQYQQRRTDYPRAFRWDPQPTIRKFRQALTNIMSG